MHLGLVAPLPPTPSGVAEWVGAALPLLEQHAQVTCFVPDPDVVSPAIRALHNVRPIDERDDPSIDMLIYHIGNNPHHEFVFDALREGPAGLVEVHDGSLHHYVLDRTLGTNWDPVEYSDFGKSAHGWAGSRLANMRWRRYRGAAELFLFDYLQIALDRSRGVIVHSKYAEELVQLRCPRVHTWRIPLHAPALTPDPQAREWTGIAPEKLLIAHLGFVTLPKRADVYIEAMRQVLDRGVDAHFVFAGKPDPVMSQRLPHLIDKFNMRDHVTITGYLSTADLEQWVQAVDVIVNLRAPHVGESSGSLAYGLSAGKPVIVQPVGSWAELPEDVVVRLPVTDDDAEALANTLFALGQDDAIGRRFGENARVYARAELDAHACAERLVQAAREATERDWTPPAWVAPGRTMAALAFLDSGRLRIEGLLGDDEFSGAASREALERITPARPHAKLLAIDVPPKLMQLLSTVWGYQVTAKTTDSPHAIQCKELPGIPAFTAEVESWDPQLYATSFAEYDVIVIGQLQEEQDLMQFNQMLTPQGLLVVLQDGVKQHQLDAAGFSPHVHEDHPGWVISFAQPSEYISVGTKACIPLDLLALTD